MKNDKKLDKNKKKKKKIFCFPFATQPFLPLSPFTSSVFPVLLDSKFFRLSTDVNQKYMRI